MVIDLVLLGVLLITALRAVMKRDLVKSAIALALTSIILSALMFRLESPLAAVFELSVCGGLITVIFMCTISLTKPQVSRQEDEEMNTHSRHFGVLMVLLMATAGVLLMVGIPAGTVLPQAAVDADARSVLWNERQLDLLGQTLVIFAGFFGILVLFKQGVPRAERTGDARMRTVLSDELEPDDTVTGEVVHSEPSAGRSNVKAEKVCQ
jgi:NADH:ubiquinone oxidoreductase subunit 6 (subunit J)